MSDQNQQGVPNKEASPAREALAKLKSSHWFEVAIAGFGLVLIIYCICSVYLSHFNLGGQLIPTRLSDTQLTAQLNQQVSHYQLKLKYPDGTVKAYRLSSLGLTLDVQKSIAALRSQLSFSQRVEWWRPVKAQLVITKDAASLNNFISSATVITVQPSVDASLNVSSGNVSVTNAVTGKQYGLNNAARQLLNAAAMLTPRPLKLVTLAVNPALTESELMPYKAELTKVLNQPASFMIEGQSISPSPSQMANWLEITPNDKTKSLSISVNSGKVLAYIDAIAAPLIHPAKAEVDVTAPDSTKQILVPGVNGVDVTNKRQVATSLANQLLAAQGYSFALPVDYQSYQTITAGDWPKWIEVDLTNKRLYAYEHANLVMTDLVSAGAPATPTVTGQFAIYAKFVSEDMRGQNVDGSGYFQPHVPWVNYFYKDFAIHGNYWRPLSYFGNINSSHGCVGLMDASAAWIYNWAPVGTPVITHT